MTTNKQAPDADKIARALRLLDLHEEMLVELKEFRRTTAEKVSHLAYHNGPRAANVVLMKNNLINLSDLIARAEAAQ